MALIFALSPSGLRAESKGDNVALAAFVAALWEMREPAPAPPATLLRKNTATYVALRRKGARLSDAWAKGPRTIDALRSALDRARKDRKSATEPDTIELVIAYDFKPVAFARREKTFFNLRRGLTGIELSHGDTVAYVGPTQVIATNRSYDKIIERFAAAQEIAPSELERTLALRSFDAEQFLVELAPGAAAIPLYRGNRLVGIEEVTQETVRGLARRMTGWMERNLRKSGRMTYKYWPSNGRESSSNNMIRQWMASLALVRAASFADDQALAERAAGNIRYNLKEFFRNAGDYGVIEYRDKIKLGALAIAALAMADHPKRSEFAAQEAALRRTIEHLWQKNGAFKTFLKPSDRNDNQNFYPGEALLYLANHYTRSGDPELFERLMTSVRYYRSWHLAARNPAFVPWHTMAYAVIWNETRDPGLRDWIFEMNDWLLDVQQKSQGYPDTDGRFFDPMRPDFGPPHASSTGVYLEGLIQAFRIARAVGDRSRTSAYRRAILRGVRSLMQLEFRDEVDLYYISKRDRVRGGLRTTVYNNEIRVDNVQHGLMALFDILKYFEPEDYRWSSR